MVPRRSLLRALGASFAVATAGCNAAPTNDGPATEPTGTPTATPTRTLAPDSETPTESSTASPTPTGSTNGSAVLSGDGGVTEFGRTVALADDAAVVLAEGHGAYAVAAADGWGDPTVLTPEDGDGFGGYNASAALDGDVAVVGGPSAGPDPNTGAVYRFERADDGWRQRAHLAPETEEETNEFGRSVAFDGDRIVVGDANDPTTMVSWVGGAYVFAGGEADWEQDVTLGTEASDLFGTAVAADGDTVLVGAPYADVDGQESGAVYAYELTDGEWRRRGRLSPSEPFGNDVFGRSVGIDGDRAIVGAPGTDGGHAYLFERTDGDWGERARLTPSELESGADFGHSVALAGGTAVVGAPQAGSTGAAYAFRAEAAWAPTRQLTAADLPGDAEFGFDVALSGSTALVGAPVYGAASDAYLFDL